MDTAERSELKKACVKHVERSLGTRVTRTDIVRMRVNDNRYKTSVDIAVGELFPERMSDSPGEVVLAIFEAEKGARYLVLTPKRGVAHGIPYLFGDQETVPFSVQYER